jgi:multicomponent K+:H+ antiporter subunit D
MNHAPIVPIALPALTAALMLLDRRRPAQRLLAWVSTLLLTACAAWMVTLASDGWRGVYLLGNWAAPWGIVLVADRLSSLMVLLSSLLGLIALAASHAREDTRGIHFLPLLQVQLMGLNGAFLTGDLFNLFVFFEVMLIASYGLLLQGDGAARVAAGLRFVALNLVGSALFLLGASLLYGVTGTLNMADLAGRVATLEGMEAVLARSAGALLLTVFCLKAAILPLGFWLPSTYVCASPPVAMVFAIMTKVGVYAVLRLFTLVFGADAGASADVAFAWLAPVAAAGAFLAMAGSLGSTDLRRMAALLVVASAGFLMTGVGLADERTIAAAVFYLPHSTLAAAALFGVSWLIEDSRGTAGCRMVEGPLPARASLLGGLFFISAVAISGLPPFGGFIAKAMMLVAMLPHEQRHAPGPLLLAFLWATLLLGSLLSLIALARAGSRLFWSARHQDTIEDEEAPLARGSVAAVLMALAGVAAVTLGAGPLQRYAQATAEDLLAPASLISEVMQARQVPSPHTTAPRPAP